MEENTTIECEKCGNKIGQMGRVGAHECLVVNGIAVNAMKGACVHCGQEFYWSISEQQLSRLIGRTLEQRKKYRA